jgi:DNA-binding MarR family transcriptional regulator
MNENTLAVLRTLVRSARSAETRLDGLLAGLGLSATRLWALQRLERSDEPLSPGELAGCMAFAKSNATQLIDHLEAARLVQRVPNPRDRRCTHLAVTESGKQSRTAALKTLGPFVERIEQSLSPQEWEQLSGLLQRLNEALK